MVSTSVEGNQDDTPDKLKQEDFAYAFPEEVYQRDKEEHNNSIGDIDLDLDEKYNLDYDPTPDNSPHLIKQGELNNLVPDLEFTKDETKPFGSLKM